MKKMLSIVLSVCMIMMYTVPVFANTSGNAVKMELSDHALAKAIGGSGELDATLSKYTAAGNVQAVVANRSTLYCTYALTITDVNGGLLQTITSGTLAPNTAAVLTGTTTYKAGGYIAKAEILNSGLPGFKSSDVNMWVGD